MSKLGGGEVEISPNLENSKFLETFEAFEVLAINLMSYNDCRKTIVKYLGNPRGVTYQKIKYMALSYVIM